MKLFTRDTAGTKSRGLARKEAHAGERLPYLSFADENVVLLRDGSLMLSLLVPGLSFETADSAELIWETLRAADLDAADAADADDENDREEDDDEGGAG